MVECVVGYCCDVIEFVCLCEYVVCCVVGVVVFG